MIYIINLTIFILSWLTILTIKKNSHNNKVNLSFHFAPYVFKNKENVFYARTLDNALTDMLQNKLANVDIDTKTLQDKIKAGFISKASPTTYVKNVEKYISQNEKAYNKYLLELNEKYFNIFEYNILKINIQKINIKLLLKSIINLSKNDTKIAVLIKNNDKNVIKTVFFISNNKIVKKIIYDKLNILSCIKNNYKSKIVTKNKTFSPKIINIKMHYNLTTQTLICVCHKNCISYSNIFGQRLAEVLFENVKFFTSRHIVNQADVTKCFIDANVILSPLLARCMKIDFCSSLVQTMYDKVCKAECGRVVKDILLLRYDSVSTNSSYTFFIQKMLGIKIVNNNFTITPDKRYINCDFKLTDYNCKVKVGNGKNEYIIDGKTFSNNIPITLNDIEKVDCILY